VGRYVKFDPKYRAYYAADNYPGPLDYEGETTGSSTNNCDGTFTDVTGKIRHWRFYRPATMGVTAADYDGDGWDDIYVANDRTENFSFHNKPRWNVRGSGQRPGCSFGQNGESTSSMGPVFADFENRGTFDLWVTDGHYNRYLRNVGSRALRTWAHRTGRLADQCAIRELGDGRLRLRQRRLASTFSSFHGGLIHLIPQEHTLFADSAAASLLISRQAALF